MVTKKTILVVFCILSLVMIGCSKIVADLGMQRKPYLGTDLKIDGYYYSDSPIWDKTIAVTIFYRDGVSILVFIYAEQDIFQSIEKKFLYNQDVLSKIRNEPYGVGVFTINNKSLEMENFVGRGFKHTYHTYGEIINDSTFIVRKFVGFNGGEEYWNAKFRFKKFSPKPDSTSVYIP